MQTVAARMRFGATRVGFFDDRAFVLIFDTMILPWLYCVYFVKRHVVKCFKCPYLRTSERCEGFLYMYVLCMCVYIYMYICIYIYIYMLLFIDLRTSERCEGFCIAIGSEARGVSPELLKASRPRGETRPLDPPVIEFVVDICFENNKHELFVIPPWGPLWDHLSRHPPLRDAIEAADACTSCASVTRRRLRRDTSEPLSRCTSSKP